MKTDVVNDRGNTMKNTHSLKYYAWLAGGSFLMVVIHFSGLFLNLKDLTGRIISGAAWSIVTLGWASQFFKARKTTKKQNGN